MASSVQVAFSLTQVTGPPCLVTVCCTWPVCTWITLINLSFDPVISISAGPLIDSDSTASVCSLWKDDDDDDDYMDD